MPYLSVVAASRNDDHGGDPLVRTQIFINSFIRQCDKYHLPAELIIVDWNPVGNRPGLAAVLSMPPDAAYCRASVIAVPSVLHCRLKYADKLAFSSCDGIHRLFKTDPGGFEVATAQAIVDGLWETL